MQLPGPVRAVVGLFAVAADEAKHLPDRAIELPMLAVSTALQMSLRAQQRYARLAARGDDLLHRRPPSDEPPSWAKFDDLPNPLAGADLGGAGLDDPDPELRARAASQLLDELLGMPGGATSPARPPADEPDGAAGKPVRKPRKAPAVKKAPAKQVTAAKKPSGKAISRPRHTPPSRFDTVDE
jgi:hypothetical protein